jgi:hypothetical protein
MTDAGRLAELRADVDFARRRRDLYRAKVYGPRETSPERLRELERAVTQAEERLAHAQRSGPDH